MKKFVEEEMVDTLKIERNVEGYRDDTFDAGTGTYTGPPLTLVYQGKGMLIPISASPTEEPEGGGEGRYTRYTAMIPLESDPVEVDDQVTLITSLRDPDLEGTTFQVESISASTFQIARTMQVEQRDFASNM